MEKIHFLLLPLIHSENLRYIFGHKLVHIFKNHKEYQRIKTWNDHTIAIKKFEDTSSK